MPAFSSDERQLLHDSLRDYFGTKYAFERYRELSRPEHADGFGRTEWQDYADLGWLGVALPESVGGSSGGATELGIVMATAGAALALEPLLATVALGANAISLAGTPDQQAQLTDIVAGNHTLAFCHAEFDSGYTRDFVTTHAQSDDDSFVLNGRKAFALHAHAADTLLVSARVNRGDGPVALFLVPSDSSGLELHGAPALDGRRGAAVILENVRVPADMRLGKSDRDSIAIIDAVIDRGVLALCAEAAGAMAAVTEQTIEYLKAREQFGQPLSKFQVLQHRLVDMNVAAEEARAVTHAALRASDQEASDAQEKIWKAKVKTAKSARFVGGQAIQLHGGMGMTDELAIGHYYKRLTMCETMFGDAEWYLQKLAERESGL
ncbi:MAG: acyl-CoA dehydrogenase family protein [Hyphomicrobiaceae bacterium]